MTSFVDVSREFSKDFTHKEFQDLKKKFQDFDEDQNGIIDFYELKRAMEKMGNPQTHIQLKDMMKELATDPDKGIHFRDFVLVQKKMKDGEGTGALAQSFAVTLKDYTPKAIINFHEAKAKESEKEIEMEKKIKEEASERKVKAEEKREAKKNFKNKLSMFEQK